MNEFVFLLEIVAGEVGKPQTNPHRNGYCNRGTKANLLLFAVSICM
jgi:hypothetical protein